MEYNKRFVEFDAIKQAATEEATGVAKFTTNAKALTGEATDEIVTPANLSYVLDYYMAPWNDIGVMGSVGAGVSICPPDYLPDGMIPMDGCCSLGHDNYGNYQFTDGSIMVYVAKFYTRIGHEDNPTYATYGVNSVDIKGIRTYPTTAAANADGYALHRAFIDGGVEMPGRFYDKYMCSKVANGTGYTAASIKNGKPISFSADHNPASELTGGVNVAYSAIDLAHRRDGENGNVNADSIFSCMSVFDRGALAMISLAHGQAATSTTNCAWYDETYNYPKGCNNALGDTDDATVSYTTDGHSNCGLTGSGTPFAKTTHNGQACGVADLNGLMYEVTIGVTCIATSPAIEAMSQASPCQITVTGHGRTTGDFIQVNSIAQADWSGCKDKIWQITRVDDNNFTIAFDASGFGTPYDAVNDPGTVTLGDFYVAKEATEMAAFTNGDSGATDHWGATGVAAMMDEFVPPFKSGYTYRMQMGSGANQVLSGDLSGAGWLLAGMGLPLDGTGVDATGTNLFGKDIFYQYVRNEMCLLSCCTWGGTSNAGPWGVSWYNDRTHSSSEAGVRMACYPKIPE